MLNPAAFNPTARHKRRTRCAIAGLEAGAVLFIAGLVALSLNPYWHFDAGGFVDWRVRWWNIAGEVLIASGLLSEVFSLIGLAAVIVSRFAKLRTWPYLTGGLLVLLVILWAGMSPAGLLRDIDAHFEWNSANGFSGFHLREWDAGAGVWRQAAGTLWQATVATQIQPLLEGYFKLHDWKKMNGDIGVREFRIIPIAWPIALGSGGETLEDPDETELMRAAAQEDLKAVQQQLSAATHAEVNALDQSGQSALILACQNSNGNPDVVKALLAAGADANLRSRNGYTALTWAQARNNREVIRLLRRAGARP